MLRKLQIAFTEIEYYYNRFDNGRLTFYCLKPVISQQRIMQQMDYQQAKAKFRQHSYASY